MTRQSLFAILVLLFHTALARATDIVCGPIVGNVSDTSVRVWMQLSTAERVTVRPVDVLNGRSPGSVTLDVEGPAPFVADMPVSQLSPDRSYRIEIDFDGKPVDYGEPLVVRSASPAGEQAAFTIALAGGLDLSAKQDVPAVAAILKLKPHFALLLGDIGRLPAKEAAFPRNRRQAFDMIAALHESIRNHRAMKPFFHQVPCLAVWGERDYGPEDSDRTFAFAKESMFAFRRYWPNPMYGTPDARGVFFSAQNGDVDFFGLDARMQRDPVHALDRKNFFGEGQLTWLKDQLKKSKAAIKIIAASSPLLADDPSGWASCKEERDDFLAFIQKEKIPGVVFVSRGSYAQILCRKTPNDLFYPLYELICPPLANITPGKPLPEPNRLGEPAVTNGFGSLTFGGTKIKRFVTLQIRDEKGEIKQDQTIFSANLEAP